MGDTYKSADGFKYQSYQDPGPITGGADARQGSLFAVALTLSNSAGTVTNVTIPDAARGFRLTPTLADVIFAVDENPAALATNTATTITTAAFSVGGVAFLGVTETRVLPEGTTRTLRLRSATASATVTLDTF